MSWTDEDLAGYLEGILPEETAAQIERALEDDAELRQTLDELRRVLEGPLDLEPVDPPAELRASLEQRTEAWSAAAPDELGDLEPVETPPALEEWVRARASEAAQPNSEDERDPLAEPIQLEPVEVPPHLEAWVRERVRPPAGEVVPFPLLPTLVSRAGWIAAAALLLACLGTWRALVVTRGDLEIRTVELDTVVGDRDKKDVIYREKTQELSDRLKKSQDRVGALEDSLTKAAKDRDAAQERASEAEALASRLARTNEQEAALLARLRGELDQANSALDDSRATLAQRNEELRRARLDRGDPAETARLARALRQAQGELKAERARADELAQALATAKGAAAPAVQEPLRVRDARGVKRWKPGEGWLAVTPGQSLQPGVILAGEDLHGRLQIGVHAQRVSPQLYVLTAKGLRPLPSAYASQRIPPTPGSYRGREPAAPSAPGIMGLVGRK